MPTNGTSSGDGPTGGALPAGFHFGVATAGFQVEGGFNGPGTPANNWLAWEQVGRVEPSAEALSFWDRPEPTLDRAAQLGCTSFRLSVEWARVFPDSGGPDPAALDHYRWLVESCVDRGLEPLVTLHHFTHPAWLGEDFWLRPDSPRRYRQWVETAAEALAGSVRCWVTINEINVLAINSWLLGTFPPGRTLAVGDAALAVDNLLAAHVAGYEVLHDLRTDAVVTTNNACASVYELDRMLTDLLLARAAGVEPGEVDEWIGDRRHLHDRALPADSLAERGLRRLSATGASYGRRSRARSATPPPRRAIDAVYASPYERTLDVLGVDFYDPGAARHFRVPGHRSAGGRNPSPARQPWDDVPDPRGLTRWLRSIHEACPTLPLWVVENGVCSRVTGDHRFPRSDGWDRPRYLRENIAAVVAAVDAGVPVTGYWHWTLADNYEWGSYEPRFGLYGIDRHRPGAAPEWLETDSLGDDAAGAYRRIIEGVRSGDRSVLAAGN